MHSSVGDNTISKSKHESMRKALVALHTHPYPQKQQTVVRPNVSLAKGLLFFIFVLTMCVMSLYGFELLLSRLHLPVRYSLLLAICIVVATLCVYLKPIIIWCVRVYQKLAPEMGRQSCSFEPSCSNYMINAIEKHGAIRGVYKGILGLFRCHYPNGGIVHP